MSADQLPESMCAEKDAACQEVSNGISDACLRGHDQKRKQLEDATGQEREKLVRQHEAATEEAADMTARREQDSKQFRFTVRGHTTPELSGSIPGQTFEAEPNSVLNKMYNGEWAYATDAAGRACINSDPAHWPLVLRWLSFNIAPDEPSKAFIAECKYWQLDNLLSKMQQPQDSSNDDGVTINTSKHNLSLTNITRGKRIGFQLEGSVHNFPDSFNKDSKEAHVVFKAFGASWDVTIQEDGAFLSLLSGPSARAAEVQISFGAHEHQAMFVDVSRCNFDPDGDGWGSGWQAGFSLEKAAATSLCESQGFLAFESQCAVCNSLNETLAPECAWPIIVFPEYLQGYILCRFLSSSQNRYHFNLHLIQHHQAE